MPFWIPAIMAAQAGLGLANKIWGTKDVTNSIVTNTMHGNPQYAGLTSLAGGFGWDTDIHKYTQEMPTTFGKMFPYLNSGLNLASSFAGLGGAGNKFSMNTSTPIVENYGSNSGVETIAKSGIYIKPSKRGTFAKYCGGKVTEECIARGKKSSSAAIRKKAVFASNARKFKH